MNERKLTKSELARREELVQKMKANKRTLVSKYGKDAEKVMYGRATKLAKQTEIMNPQTANKVKEAIKLSLMKPVKKSSVKEQDIEVGADRYETEQAISKLPNSVEIVYTDTGRWYGLYTNGKLYQDTREGSQDYLNSFIVPLGGEAITLPPSFDMDELESVENTLKQVGVPKVTSGDYKDVSEGMEEDLDIGHQDDEPHMLRANLYNIGKYAFDLLEMLEKYDNMEGEVDFPHWWQAKIIKALDYMEKTKHYLENEEALNKMDSTSPQPSPELDPMIDKIMENVLKRLK